MLIPLTRLEFEALALSCASFQSLDKPDQLALVVAIYRKQDQDTQQEITHDIIDEIQAGPLDQDFLILFLDNLCVYLAEFAEDVLSYYLGDFTYHYHVA